MTITTEDGIPFERYIDYYLHASGARPVTVAQGQDLDRPLGPPNRTIRPPTLPGAKGEFLTSEVEDRRNDSVFQPYLDEAKTIGNNLLHGKTIFNRPVVPSLPDTTNDPMARDLGYDSIKSIPILRHGETAENEKNIAHGWSDEPLTATGRDQVLNSALQLVANSRRIPYRPYGYPHRDDMPDNETDPRVGPDRWQIYKDYLKQKKPGDNLQDWLNKNHQELPGHDVGAEEIQG